MYLDKFNYRFVLIVSVAALVFVLFACDKEETLDAPSNITASQGTYMGVVHLNWAAVPNAHYNIERKGTDGNWLDAGYISTPPPFDDYGFNLSDNKIDFGTHYSYRIKSVSSDYDDSQFTNVSNEGWAYVLQPININITNENGEIKLSWSDTNAFVQNIQYLWYEIQEKYLDSDSYHTIHSTDHLNKGNRSQTYSFASNSESDLTAWYRVKASYSYKYKNMDTETNGLCELESNEQTISEGGNGNETSSYQWNSLGSFGSCNNGISFAKTKNYNNVLYTVILDNPSSGNPILYQSDGSSFNNISASYPVALQNSFSDVDFTVMSDTKYMAGVSDSAYVYSYNGTWSSNLASNNFGYNNKPQSISIESNGQDIFTTIYTYNNELVVKKWNHDTVWDDNINIINSNSISNIEMIQLNGQIYLYYLISNSSYNSTLYIKHYDGNSWVSDLEWTRDNLMEVKISGDANNLYFISNSQQPDNWAGSAFKVSSSSTVVDLLTSSEEWIVFPSSLTVNTNGDLMLIYTHIVSASQVNPELAVLKNNLWSKVSGDYTNGVFPANINSTNQDFFFIYGDAQNISASYYPINLKVSSLSEN